MNEKKLYKVTITDENGKVVHEVESEGSRGGHLTFLTKY